ncbi:MAG TPA: tetratricopeptide repeat protein [bacterium]|nr:tetratricopeptide repeat protein [bacterium]
MHKRKKGEYGIFYTAVKKYLGHINIYKYFIPPFASILFVLFFLLLQANATNVKAATVQSDTVFNTLTGFVYYYDGDYGRAIKYFKKEPGDLLKNHYFNYVLASLYFKNGEYKKSLNHINLALKIRNKKGNTIIKYLILKAKITADTGKLKESIKILKNILKENPYNLKTLLFLSNLYTYKRDLKTAIFYLNIMKLNHPNNINSYYMLSKIYMTQNKKKKAEENLLSLIKIDPYFKKAYFRLAAVYVLSGRDKDAVNALGKYLKINHDSEAAIYQSAILYYIMKNYKASIRLFLNFIDITKNTTGLKNNAYFFIGTSYILQKNYKSGIAFLNKLKPGKHYIDAKLREIAIYLNSYRESGEIKYKQSIENIIADMLLNIKLKKNLRFYYFSAIALTEINDYKKSEDIIKAGLKDFHNNTALLYELGSTYHYLKKGKKARAVMKKILKINPYNADALNYLGYNLAINNKNLKKAKTLIDRALSYDKGSPFILDSLGFVYYREKQYAKALKLFKLSLKKLGKSAIVLKHTGMDYFMLKKYKRALEYLKKSYKIKKSKEVKRYMIKINKIR